MSEKTKQVGGSHYHAEGGYEHWDWIVDMKMPYLPATATKYVARWRKKNGLQDLLKAQSYLDKMVETYATSHDPEFKVGYRHAKYTDRFIESAGLKGKDADFMIVMCGKRDMAMITCAKQILSELISEAKRTAGAA